jgi:hypothetical protein
MDLNPVFTRFVAQSEVSGEYQYPANPHAWSKSNAHDTLNLLGSDEVIEGYVNYHSDPYLPTTLSWNTAQPRLSSIIDLATAITPVVTDILSTFNPLLLSNQLLRGSSVMDFTFQHLHHPSTWKLLRKQSMPQQLLQMIFHRLLNDPSAINMLQDLEAGHAKLLQAGMRHMFTLGPSHLISILDSVPSLYRPALEQGLFCKALEFGDVRLLEVILRRGFDLNMRFHFLNTFAEYPLNFSYRLRHVEATRLLIEYGADVKKTGFNYPITEHIECHARNHPAILRIMRMLLEAGASFTVPRYHIAFNSYHVAEIAILADQRFDCSFKFFIRGRVLFILSQMAEWGPRSLSVMREVLKQDSPKEAQNLTIWNDVLTQSLSAATFRARTEAVNLLISAGALPTTHCLIHALLNNDLGLFKRFLDFGLDPNAPLYYDQQAFDLDGTGLPISRPKCTALSVSIEHNLEAAFHTLEERGVIAELASNNDGLILALKAACKVGNSSLVQLLMGQLGKFRHRSFSLGEVYKDAVEAGREDMIKHLLSLGIIPGLSSIHSAVKKRDVALTTLLLDAVDVLEDPKDLSTNVLLEAIIWGNTQVVEKLFAVGWEVNKTVKVHRHHINDIPSLAQCTLPYGYEQGQFSGLSLAILGGFSDAVKLYLASFSREEFSTEVGRDWCVTALTACVVRQDVQLLQKLLVIGVDPCDNPAIYTSVINKTHHITKILIDAFVGRYPRGCRGFGSDALLCAIGLQEVSVLRQLAETGDITTMVTIQLYNRSVRKSAWSTKISPFGRAIGIHCQTGGVSEVFPILLPYVKNPNIHVFEGWRGKMTAILYAIHLGSLHTARILYAAGANISLPALCGLRRTPLQEAVEAGREDIVQFLIEQGVSVNEAPAVRGGATSLQLAAIKGFIGIAATLLEKGAEINADPAPLEGRTAFEGATEHGRIEMMVFLFQNGADLLMEDRRQYKRAVMFAEENHQHAAVQLAKELLSEAQKQEAARLMQVMDFGVPGCDMGGFGDLSF